MSDESNGLKMPVRLGRRRAIAAEILGLGGLGLLAMGCAMIYTPLAYIVIGCSVLAGGIILARRS